MSPSFRRGARSLLAAAFLALPAASGAQDFILFPESEQVFRQLIADPRHIALGASYYRLGGKDTADAALGHSWGLTQWASNHEQLRWQTSLDAMAHSRFTMGGGVNQFETVDFIVGLPLAVRHGIWSGRAELYHQSSHLGDDFIRRTGQLGFRYSMEGAKLHAAIEPLPWLRAYAGADYRLHTIPSLSRWNVQYGFELTGHDFNVRKRFPMRLFLAQDFQNPGYADFGLNSNTEAGLIIGYRDVKRVMRVYGGYYEGRSPYGQFFQTHEHYLDFGISLHL